jgi:hypothetical protein
MNRLEEEVLGEIESEDYEFNSDRVKSIIEIVREAVLQEISDKASEEESLKYEKSEGALGSRFTTKNGENWSYMPSSFSYGHMCKYCGYIVQINNLVLSGVMSMDEVEMLANMAENMHQCLSKVSQNPPNPASIVTPPPLPPTISFGSIWSQASHTITLPTGNTASINTYNPPSLSANAKSSKSRYHKRKVIK